MPWLFDCNLITASDYVNVKGTEPQNSKIQGQAGKMNGFKLLCIVSSMSKQIILIELNIFLSKFDIKQYIEPKVCSRKSSYKNESVKDLFTHQT